jgi:lipopolysaccharide/colanic/teichoic acid biosynthesis glycosyltransferase
MSSYLTDCPPDAEPRRIPAAASQDNSNRVPAWKRVLDVSCILLALPILLPLGFLISALIKAVSSGPVLFKQQRIGFRGQRFFCLKFRTMHVNADTGVHQGHLKDLMNSDKPMVKLDAVGDRRLIKFGLILRSLGIDELPQLINVLRGEMSLVGPRPCIPYEYETFLPRHRKRCDTLPGLTGLWQVNGKNLTTFEQMIDFDLQYVREKSLWLDIKILAKTIPAILAQAYEVKIRRRAARKNGDGGQTGAVNTTASVG